MCGAIGSPYSSAWSPSLGCGCKYCFNCAQPGHNHGGCTAYVLPPAPPEDHADKYRAVVAAVQRAREMAAQW